MTVSAFTRRRPSGGAIAPWLLFFLLFAGSSASVRATAPVAESTRAAESPSESRVELAQESRQAAGEDEQEQEQFKHSPSVQLVARLIGLSPEHAYWLCVVLNFAIVAGAILYFSKKNLPALFRDRTQAIQKAIQEARQASDEANRRLGDIEARLSRLGAEIEDMRAAAEKEALAEEGRIQAAAEEDARKIVDSAEQEIAAAARSARRELKAYAAGLAVSLAARQIRVDAATDQTLVRGFAQQLAQNRADGGPQDRK